MSRSAKTVSRGLFASVTATLLLGAAGALSQPAAPPTAPAAGAPTAAPSSAPAASASAPVVPRRRKASDVPDPTPAQLEALAELQREAERYERDAREYRGTITRIVKHHYEQRRKQFPFDDFEQK